MLWMPAPSAYDTTGGHQLDGFNETGIRQGRSGPLAAWRRLAHHYPNCAGLRSRAELAPEKDKQEHREKSVTRTTDALCREKERNG